MDKYNEALKEYTTELNDETVKLNVEKILHDNLKKKQPKRDISTIIQLYRFDYIKNNRFQYFGSSIYQKGK